MGGGNRRVNMIEMLYVLPQNVIMKPALIYNYYKLIKRKITFHL